jgi:4-amino-4-deoxy-L-arabinose transferase-like glycosyltransferase
MTATPFDRWAPGWRGPWLAALIALLAAAPGIFAVPALDRDEARLAQASAQMLETGDFAATAVDDQAPDRRPVGLHWLQALGVAATSSAEARRIWAYRIPAVAGAALSAAACAWGGAALFGEAAGLLAGAVLGASFLLSTAGVVAAPEALTCGGLTLAMAAFARLYLVSKGLLAAARPTRLLLWLGLALAALSGGPIGPVVFVLAAGALALWDRGAPWLRALGWSWGLILLAALVGPSVVAGLINATPDAAPGWPGALAGGRTPGFHLLTAPLTLFPFALLAPLTAIHAWRARAEPGVRLALCWLIPGWLVMEFGRGLPLAGGLVFFSALAWLCGAALRAPPGLADAPIAIKIGAALQALAGVLYAILAVTLALRFGGGGDALAWGIVAGLLLAGAGLAGAGLALNGRLWGALATAGVLGVCAHVALLAGLAPRLQALWLSQRAVAAIGAAGLDPRGGVTPGPVAVVGYGEPSLTFALGGQSELDDAQDAAEAIGDGRPVIVEARREDAFLASLKAAGHAAVQVGRVEGFNYSNGETTRLLIYRPGP